MTGMQQEASGFLFESSGFEMVQREGRELCEAFYDRLAVDGLEEGAPPPNVTEEELRSLVSSSPRTAQELPLRALIRLADAASRGPLERFFAWPLLADGETPASQPFRQWAERNATEFSFFFPEQLIGGSLVAVDLEPHPDVWVDIKRTGHELAAAVGVEFSSVAAFYVLARDYTIEIGPLLDELGVSHYSVVVGARRHLERQLALREGRGATPPSDFGLKFGSLQQIRLREEGFRSKYGLPSSAASIMFAFLLEPDIEGDSPFDDAKTQDAVAELLSRTTKQELKVDSRALSDLPAETDTLGFEPLVDGLQRLLNDRGTSLPLAVAVTAPWGSGKSSVMLQIEKALLRGEGLDEPRNWIPVRFPAWKYERSERMWAALSKAIYEQAQDSKSRWGRICFRARLQWRRLDAPSFFARVFLPPLALVGFAVGLGLAGEAIGAVAASLLGLAAIGGSGRAAGVLSDPFKRALDAYATAGPRYDDQLGFTSEADADIGNMTELLTESGDGSALAVFVDDLDRCSPRHVVEIVEAINQIFNATERGECLFVLGMDRDVVAASIEVAYASTIEKLPEERREGFGLFFLAKLVQLAVMLPPPSSAAIEKLLDHSAQRTVAGRRPANDAVDEYAKAIADFEPPTLAGIESAAQWLEEKDLSSFDPRAEDALHEAAKRSRDAVITDENSPDVREAESVVLRHLRPNPREIKRFDNAFRLQLLVANRTPGCDLAFDSDDLVSLGKWVAVRLRWPQLADALDRDPELLGRLEEECWGAEAPFEGPLGCWLADDDLREALKDGYPQRRMSRLDSQTFLRVS